MSDQFEFLYDFLANRMRMSHIYQPVMLIHLFENGGHSHAADIAKSILIHDPTQIEYYENVTKRMPGRVLRNREVVAYSKGDYSIPDFGKLSDDEIHKLIETCSKKLDDFLQNRRSGVWDHRKKSSGYISGSKKYEVLKQAKFRCQLCGISALEKALEADHIVPRNQGGTDDIDNLQALCFSCNAMKRDTDDTDFRYVEDDYKQRKDDCLYCHPDKDLLLKQERLAYSTHAEYSAPDHILIVPRRHIENYFGLYKPELNTIQRLLDTTQAELQQSEESVVGFEVSFQASTTKGESREHAHLDMFVKRNS